MKFYIDTEFVDDGHAVDLISIGIVAEDGREFYAQSVEFDHRKASDWVKEHVLKALPSCVWAPTKAAEIPGLYRTDKAYHKRQHGQCIDQWRGLVHNCPWRTREQLRNEIQSFISGEKPEFWGWCAGYDFVALCQLFGTMMDAPDSWPHYMRDIQYILDERGIPDDQLPQQEEQAHNALSDARYIKRLWEWLQGGQA